ncbi:beta-glucosidase family protein [Undibacterium sp. Di26W]|uniref:beta-glucosidase family protein n=1 Tax=Undibacterium sp. Di26W TaxID=3413035 RepID=UPI003BEFB029
MFKLKISVLAVAGILCTASANSADLHPVNTVVTSIPWMNTSLTADQRADLVLKEMTQDEKLKLVFGHFGSELAWKNLKMHPAAIPHSAGYVEGVPRLGIPAQFETDAGVGVATQGSGPTARERTSLSSGMSTAASWNQKLAFKSGAMIGAEARASGFNVMLAGGVNLMREPRNGRNFEYAGEDPLLAGTIVAAQINGIQSNHVISTLKHYAVNSQETGRFTLNAKIDDASARMSDLLAMQIAIEKSDPGSVMCSYNRLNGVYACENDYLLNQVLKADWGYHGYVMSDWGATHSTVAAANNGLDQESGWEFDASPYFSGALKEAVTNGAVPQARLDNMLKRILRTMFDKGLFDYPVPKDNTIDFAAHALVSQYGAEEGMVLLKNDANVLPLHKDLKKIAIIGSHADVGVLSGGGSSQVYPIGGNAVKGLEPAAWPGPVVYHPSSPLKAIQRYMPQAQISYDTGTDIKAATALAAQSDIVLVFATQWIGEANDAVSLSLPSNQDALITALAAANKKTVVVLETGGPVTMPWINQVASVLEAWYPGTSGGEAIARVLVGEVNPSGHLPVSFAASESQLPRPVLDGDPAKPDQRFDVSYHEGATIGYKWFDAKGLKPLFAFGHGLSYTKFAYSGFSSKYINNTMQVKFTVTNTGKVAGKDVPQVYVSPTAGKWEAPKRLVAWDKVELLPGESKSVSLNVDLRLLGMYDSKTKTWQINAAAYKVILARSAGDSDAASITVNLPASSLNVLGKKIK